MTEVRPENPVKLNMTEGKSAKVRSIVDRLVLTDTQVKQVMDTLTVELKQGLSADPKLRKLTSLQCENTYVRSLLDGSENGDFLALDLGGTNFRVLLCRLKNGVCESISRNYNVPTPKLYEPCVGVFDHLAESIHKFLLEENLLHQKLPLGFTFSFPMTQNSIKEGVLVTWTKSFACTDGVGQDAVRLLEEAIARRGDIQVEVVAVLNDTTGTLLAGSYLDKQCYIGLIMGTGCNAAYVEDLDNVEKWQGIKDEPKQVVIDIEWGAFGDNGSLDFTKTEFDNIVDMNSNHKGSFTYEKLFGGHYIGDLARLVLLKLAEEGLIFNGYISERLREWKSFTAEHLSHISLDTDEDLTHTNEMLTDLGLIDASSTDDKAVSRYVCAALTERATQFISACLAALLNHMKRPVCTIAIDGSLYKYHPHLHDKMTRKIHELAPNTKSKLILAEDGSGRGAAFVAAVAVKQAQKS